MELVDDNMPIHTKTKFAKIPHNAIFYPCRLLHLVLSEWCLGPCIVRVDKLGETTATCSHLL